ncbi:MAG: metallophosphoesterase [Clostridiales bacterium]|nr:metallophosphoesterase [Clostridiales bacterium]
MKILVVSDTHGRDRDLERAVEREAPFDRLIHCGDVEGREIFIEALADCPCCIVAGNNDFFCDLPREQEIMVGGKKALVTHGHYYGVSIDLSGIADEARSRGCEIAFFGHTHKPVVAEKDGVLVINPGSLSYPRQSGHKSSYVVLNTDIRGNVEAEIKYLD